MKTTVFLVLVLAVFTSRAEEDVRKGVKRGISNVGHDFDGGSFRHDMELIELGGGMELHEPSDLRSKYQTRVVVTKKIEVPVPKPYPVPVVKKVPVPVLHPVAIPVEKPYAVPVPKPVPVSVVKHVPCLVEKKVPVPVKVPVKVPVLIPVPVPVHKPVPIHFHDPVIVKKQVPVFMRHHDDIHSGLSSAGFADLEIGHGGMEHQFGDLRFQFGGQFY